MADVNVEPQGQEANPVITNKKKEKSRWWYWIYGWP
jgi:hypothetical protein